MSTRTLYNIVKALFMSLCCIMAISCTDTLEEEQMQDGTSINDKGIGEMVLFTVGATENAETRADEPKTYYMPDSYRFVCRMYYKAQTGSEYFDVEGGTDRTAWLKVSGPIGNSLYWNNNYQDVGTNKGVGGVDDYGNDYAATAFYWQNRKEHAFLAWTDLNHATELSGSSSPYALKMEKDLFYEEHTGKSEKQTFLMGYKLAGKDDLLFATIGECLQYVQDNYNEIKNISAQQTDVTKYPYNSAEIDSYSRPYNYARYFYKSGLTVRNNEKYDPVDAPTEENLVSYNIGPYFYWLWGEGQEAIYVRQDGDEEDQVADEDGKYWVKNNGVKVALKTEYTDAEGNPHVKYLATWPSGLFHYDFTQQPQISVAIHEYMERKDAEIVNEYPALRFDLTRGTSMNSITDQPDICQALTIKAPDGATQEANRVTLKFKHQFSQIQVNVKNAADNSVELKPSDIDKIELLGVTENGYIFTEIQEDGKIKKAAYQEINFSKYSEQELKDNEFGTKFEMFPMPQAETNYLRSFNAIAYGQLQAIRITWYERDSNDETNTEYPHVSTYRVPTELVNLESGMRYVWNIEIRRGTIAIIRAKIVDWDLPTDEPHNGNAEGTIKN